MDVNGETLDVLLGALAAQLRSLGASLETVVIGGSALTALGLVRRTTKDVDLLAIAQDGELQLARPLPEALLTARAGVTRPTSARSRRLRPSSSRRHGGC